MRRLMFLIVLLLSSGTVLEGGVSKEVVGSVGIGTALPCAIAAVVCNKFVGESIEGQLRTLFNSNVMAGLEKNVDFDDAMRLLSRIINENKQSSDQVFAISAQFRIKPQESQELVRLYKKYKLCQKLTLIFAICGGVGAAAAIAAFGDKVIGAR